MKKKKNIMYDKKSKVIVKITNITPLGAFCELKDSAGLIHISEFSDFFVRDIREFVNVGDNVKVEILDFDPVKKHVKLSYKNCRPELLKKENNPTEETLPNSESLVVIKKFRFWYKNYSLF